MEVKINFVVQVTVLLYKIKQCKQFLSMINFSCFLVTWKLS